MEILIRFITWVVVVIVTATFVYFLEGSSFLQGGISVIVAIKVDDFIKRKLSN